MNKTLLPVWLNEGGLKFVFLNTLLFAGREGQERQQGGQRGKGRPRSTWIRCPLSVGMSVVQCVTKRQKEGGLRVQHGSSGSKSASFCLWSSLF